MVRGSWKTVIRDVDRLYTEGTAALWSDDQLLARYITARDDSNTAFETIVRRHGPMVLEVCRRLLGNYDDAQDAFQATFLVLARRAGSIAPHPSQSLGPWLYQVASRTARKARGARRRREARERRAASRSETTIQAEAPNSLDHDEYQVLHEEVAKLPEKYRAAVVLCYFAGLTHDQAAASLRWPVGTVRGYLARARDLLRSRLVRRGVAPALAISVLDSSLSSASMLTPPLIDSVLEAIGKGSAARTVAALSGSMVRGLAIARVRRLLLAFTFLALGVGGSGLAALLLRRSTDREDPARPEIMVAAQVAEKPVPREHVDLYGAPLPNGAVARLGTERFNHGQELAGVTYSLGGKSILTVGGDGSIRVWDASSRGERFTIGGGEVHATSFACTRDGASLFTFDGESFIRKWDLTTGHEQGRWHPRDVQGFFQSMAVSPNAKILALAGLNDKTVYLWDVEKPGETRRLVGDEQDICDLAFSTDGRFVATAGMDGIPQGAATNVGPDRREQDRERGSVCLWEVSTGREALRSPVEGCSPRCLAFSPDGKSLAAGFSDATIRFYQVPMGKEVARLRIDGPMQGCLAFSPDGSILASGTYPQIAEGGNFAEIHLWDVNDRKELRRFPAHDQLVSGVSFSPDGRTLASCGAETAIRLWDVASGSEINPAMAPHSAICTLVVSRADGSVITGGNDTTIRRWEPSTGRELGKIGTHPGPVHDLAISDDGRSLLSASLDGTVRLWDLVTGRERLRLVDGRLKVRTSGLCFSPDGRFAGAGGKIWEAATGREVAILRDEKGEEFSPWSPATVVFTRDSTGLIWTDKTAIRLRDMASGQSRRIAQSADVIVPSPDGRFVAAGVGSVIRVWHIDSGREVAQISGHGEDSLTLAFSPDGRLLASGSGGFRSGKDFSVRVWELASAREVRRFNGHRAGITAVAFFPDGRRIASASSDATAMVWDLAGPKGAPLAAVELDQVWADLAEGDAGTAYRSIWTLTAVPDRTVTFLAERLKPISSDDPAKDTSLGPVATGETLRRLRAIAVLEKIGTPLAHRVLERLATGLDGRARPATPGPRCGDWSKNTALSRRL